MTDDEQRMRDLSARDTPGSTRLYPTDGVRAILDALDASRAKVERLRAEADEDDARERRLRELLTGVAVALRGPQPPGGLWSWHDLPERAAAARAQARRAAIEEAAAVCFALAYSSDWPGDQEQDRAATYAHAASEVRALLTPEPREGA